MTNKTHYAVIAGELAPGTRVTDEKFSKVPDLIRASFQAVNRLVPEEGKLNYEIIRMDEFLALSESPVNSLRPRRAAREGRAASASDAAPRRD